MSKEQAIERLNELDEDSETSHVAADRILLDFLKENGFREVAEAFENAENRVTFWYS